MVGAILAGGAGRRIGGAKAARELAGQPLAAYPAAALAAVCDRVAIVTKPDSAAPALRGVERWDEPPEPRHPLTGIVHALERADGQPLLVCAVDMPFVTSAALERLAAALVPGRHAAGAVAAGVVQPVLAAFAHEALEPLRSAPADAPLTRSILALDPALTELPARVVRSVDTPEELAAAERELRRAPGA